MVFLPLMMRGVTNQFFGGAIFGTRFVALLHKVGLKNKKLCYLKIKIISLIVFTRGLGGTFF